MPLVPAKCPECGGNINIDPNERLGVCEYCKRPFVVEEAINNFNTTYKITNNNEIKADVVNVYNVYDNSDKDFVIKAGELIEYNGESMDVVIPDGVRKISSKAFKNSNVVSVLIPNSIDRLVEWNFSGCKKLQKVSLPESILELGDKTFENCEALFEISIPKQTEKIGEWCFRGCKSLKHLDIPPSVKFIGHGAFQETAIEKIYLNDGTTILDGVFESCSNLMECRLPADMDYIGHSMFKNCYKLGELSIPDSVIQIGREAFAGCLALKEVVLPTTVKYIDHDAFAGCQELKTVLIEDGVETIRNRVFEGCINLKSIKIPSSIKEMGLDVFSGCNQVENVSGSMESIRNNITCFDERSPFIKEFSRSYCPKCGGAYGGIFKKKCTNCGYEQ